MTEDKTIITITNLSKAYEDHQVLSNINLSIKQGEFITFLGPSGCGKTTLLRLISGFIQPDQGSIILNGKDCKNIPANLRNVHTVFQNYALFPHMSVFENVAFGLRCQKVSRDEIQKRVDAALQMVKLNHLSGRGAKQLSGGQQQRVAIARAVVNRPLALLLDEPLSSLDYRLRKSMQIELKHLQRELGIAFIFVTHDQEEALSMSDRIVILDEGCIQQIGTPRQVYEEPENLTVAKFIGEVNIFEGTVKDILEEANKMQVTLGKHDYELENLRNFQKGESIYVLLRPEDMRILAKDSVEQEHNILYGKIEEVIYKGTTVDMMVRLDNNQLIAVMSFFNEDDENLIYSEGETIKLEWYPGWEVVLPYEA